jgi:hypothetical protein
VVPALDWKSLPHLTARAPQALLVVCSQRMLLSG